MLPESEAGTKALLRTFVSASTAYLGAQQALNVMVWLVKASSQTFTIGFSYFVAPAVSIVCVCALYFVMFYHYRPKGEHYLLYFACFVVLIVPQLVPPFVHGLNIIYTTWTFILATSATGAVVFQDLAFPRTYGQDRDAQKFVFEELKFYLDRMSFAWVALGTITGVAMTILWQGPQHSFIMTYTERVLWAVYMVFGFLAVSTIVAVFAGLPIYRDLVKVRRAYIENRDEKQPDSRGSGGSSMARANAARSRASTLKRTRPMRTQ